MYVFMLFIEIEIIARFLIDIITLSFFFLDPIANAGRETENGDVVCERRWSYPCTFFIILSFPFPSLLTCYLEPKKKVSPPSRT